MSLAEVVFDHGALDSSVEYASATPIPKFRVRDLVSTGCSGSRGCVDAANDRGLLLPIRFLVLSLRRRSVSPLVLAAYALMKVRDQPIRDRSSSSAPK
jgi:hypothetical protein